MKRKPYKPVVSGRASICEWSLEAKFRTKEQASKALLLISREEIDYSVSMEKDGELYVVTINRMSWATNLTRIGKILEKCDYYDEC